MSHRFAFIIFVLLIVAGCGHKPTKVYNKQEVNVSALSKGLKKPIQINDKTVIIDAREPFEFAIAHLPQSTNLSWREFADVRGPTPGQLKTDVEGSVRRLALLGLDPEVPVVVVDSGLAGKGEAGRLAWTLLYLGIRDVQVSQVDSLGLNYSNLDAPPRKNAKLWEPIVVSSILAKRSEVVKVATSKFDGKTFIIDVRTRMEYFSKNRQLQYEAPDLRAIHMEWKVFFTDKGRPDPRVIGDLKSLGIKSDSRIILISNNGVRSGAVTYALLSLGYSNAANFAGGYSELLQ